MADKSMDARLMRLLRRLQVLWANNGTAPGDRLPRAKPRRIEKDLQLDLGAPRPQASPNVDKKRLQAVMGYHMSRGG